MTPSTAWREDIPADEAQRFDRYAEQLSAMQKSKSQRYGAGRALHRKQVLALSARFEVLDGLPAHTRHGIFARAATYDARVRLSNGSMNIQSDRTPDVRGFGLKILGVEGPSALGGDTKSQSFVLIDRPTFGFAKPDFFVGLVLAAAEGPFALILYFLRSYGIIRGWKELGKLAKAQKKPFSGFATERFFSAVPIACGPYAARVRLLPGAPGPLPSPAEKWSEEVKAQLSRAPLVHDLQLQFFVDEATTPIEDASVDWPETAAPFTTVARLTIPQQDFSGEEFRRLAAEVEKAAFDPWDALADHRPLGAVMRARKAAYFKSQTGRGVS